MKSKAERKKFKQTNKRNKWEEKKIIRNLKRNREKKKKKKYWYMFHWDVCVKHETYEQPTNKFLSMKQCVCVIGVMVCVEWNRLKENFVSNFAKYKFQVSMRYLKMENNNYNIFFFLKKLINKINIHYGYDDVCVLVCVCYEKKWWNEIWMMNGGKLLLLLVCFCFVEKQGHRIFSFVLLPNRNTKKKFYWTKTKKLANLLSVVNTYIIHIYKNKNKKNERNYRTE